MKNLVFYLFVISSFLLLSFSTSAQIGDPLDPEDPIPLTGICYLYDDAGNRTVRYVCGGPHPRPAPGDQPVESDAVLSSQQSGDVHEVHVRVYPNPATDVLHVAVQTPVNTRSLVEVYSTSGILMLREPMDLHRGHNRTTLQVSHLPSGIYLLRIVSDDVAFETRRVYVR